MKKFPPRVSLRRRYRAKRSKNRQQPYSGYLSKDTIKPVVAKLFDPRAKLATAWPLEGRIQCDLRDLMVLHCCPQSETWYLKINVQGIRRAVVWLSLPAPDLDGGRPGVQAWWETPCADTKCLGRGWSMKSSISTYHKKLWRNLVT